MLVDFSSATTSRVFPESILIDQFVYGSCGSTSAVSSPGRWEGLRSEQAELGKVKPCNVGWIAVSYISDVKPIPFTFYESGN